MYPTHKAQLAQSLDAESVLVTQMKKKEGLTKAECDQAIYLHL